MLIRVWAPGLLLASLAPLGCGAPLADAPTGDARSTQGPESFAKDAPAGLLDHDARADGANEEAPADVAGDGLADLGVDGPCAAVVNHDDATNTFTVQPSADDTLCIGTALRAAAQGGPGATVHLVAGAYVVGPIEVTGFDGVLRGEGRGATTLSPTGGAVCATATDAPGLLFFRGGFPRIEQLGMQNDLAVACEDGAAAATSIVVTTATCGGDVSSALSDVEVVGRGLLVRPAESLGCDDASMTGEHVVTSSRFVYDFLRLADGTGRQPATGRAIEVKGLIGGSVRVGGSCDESNELTAQSAFSVGGAADVMVSHNIVNGMAFQTLVQVDLAADAVGQARVNRNHFTATGVYVRGVVVRGADSAHEVDVVVEDNLFAPFGETRGSVAIVGAATDGALNGGARGVVVRGNRLTGTMDFGVQVEDGTGWSIVDNDVRDLGARMTRIALGERTTASYVESSLALGQYDVKDSGAGNTLVEVVATVDGAGTTCIAQ